MMNARDLFPNLVRANRIAPDEAEDPVPAAEDPDAFHEGQGFFLAPADEEQEEWVGRVAGSHT